MLVIRETSVNTTENCIFSESDWYEPYTNNLGKLFKTMLKEYGRCVSKVYVNTPDGGADQIGWVFEKRAKYEDTKETYLQETWVTHKQVKEL